MKRRDVMAAAAGSLAGLPAGGASAESGLLVGSLGAQWKRAALNLGVEFRSIEQPDKSWIVKWSNQGVFGVRGGIEMPMAEMPSIEGLRLAVMHEPLPVGLMERLRDLAHDPDPLLQGHPGRPPAAWARPRAAWR